MPTDKHVCNLNLVPSDVLSRFRNVAQGLYCEPGIAGTQRSDLLQNAFGTAGLRAQIRCRVLAKKVCDLSIGVGVNRPLGACRFRLRLWCSCWL